ncbi:thioredoxin domain-containing protein [bacterium]|nr:thioredoxin domain-containing protein [bacterium]
MNKKNIVWLVIFILTLVGLGVSIHLLQIDYNVHFKAGYSPECDLNETVSCSKVAESPYAFLLGIPVASWGILGYLLVLLYMLFNRKKEHLIPNLTIFYGIFTVGSIYWFLIAKIVLKAVCIYCSTTYVINWGLFLFLILWNFKSRKESKFCIVDQIKRFFGFTVYQIPVYSVVAITVILLSYIYFPKQMDKMCKNVNCSGFGTCKVLYGKTECQCNKGYFAKDNECLNLNTLLDKTYPNGVFDAKEWKATAGSSAEDAIEIELFSDYECPYCEKLEENMKKVLENYPNVRLIRREYPLDGSCNPLLKGKQFHLNACNAAYFAKCAGKLNNLFWQACGYLHHNRKSLSMDSLLSYADMFGINKNEMAKCMASEEVKESVFQDLKLGLKHKIMGTPAFVIDKKLYSGALSYEKIKEILSSHMESKSE